MYQANVVESYISKILQCIKPMLLSHIGVLTINGGGGTGKRLRGRGGKEEGEVGDRKEEREEKGRRGGKGKEGKGTEGRVGAKETLVSQSVDTNATSTVISTF